MKLNLRESFLPYCDLYPSKKVSRTRKNVGLVFILEHGELIVWLDGCGSLLVDLM